MADIVVLGSGLSGTLMAYELVPKLRAQNRLTVIGQGSLCHVVPSNPWLVVGWRDREDIEVVVEGPLGPLRQDRVREVLPAQDPARKSRTVP